MQIRHFDEFLKSNPIFPNDYNLIYLKLKSLLFYRDVGSFGSIISKSRFEVKPYRHNTHFTNNNNLNRFSG